MLVHFHEVHCVRYVLTCVVRELQQGSAVSNRTWLLCTYGKWWLQQLFLLFNGELQPGRTLPPTFDHQNICQLICHCDCKYLHFAILVSVNALKVASVSMEVCELRNSIGGVENSVELETSKDSHLRHQTCQWAEVWQNGRKEMGQRWMHQAVLGVSSGRV